MTRIEEIKDYLGITKWNKAGYTGKGIKILSIENVSSKSKFPTVIALNGYNTTDTLDKRNHADKVMQQMMDIAKDATYYTCSKQGNTDNWKPLYLDYILKENINLFTSSRLSTQYETSSTVEKYMQECIDNGTTFFIGAGNRLSGAGSKKIYPEAKSDKYLTIGACEYDEDSVGKAFYSCEGEELDYMTVVGYEKESGTSYATNRFCAMCSLVQQMFLEKCGRTLYRSELINFINDNTKDLQKEGFDIYTGNGIFILPDPSTVDVNKYLTSNVYIDNSGFPKVDTDNTKLILTIDSKTYSINGEEKVFDTATFIKDNRTFVPIRLLEELGLKVEWKAETRQVIVQK